MLLNDDVRSLNAVKWYYTFSEGRLQEETAFPRRCRFFKRRFSDGRDFIVASTASMPFPPLFYFKKQTGLI
jgi:hypothetical protein